MCSQFHELMPLIFTSDDIFYEGPTFAKDTYSFYASHYAGVVHNIATRKIGNPPVFLPISSDIEILTKFLDAYIHAFRLIVSYIEGDTVDFWSFFF